MSPTTPPRPRNLIDIDAPPTTRDLLCKARRAIKAEIDVYEFNFCGLKPDELARARAEYETSPDYLALIAERDRLQTIVDRERLIERLAEAGAPRKDIGRIVNGPMSESGAMQHLANADAAGHWLVVLSGPPGTGKSTAAGAWLARQRTDIRFITSPEFARIDRWDREGNEKLERVGCLVLDDLGSEWRDDKGAFEGRLDALVNARYAHQRRTVITTNMPLEKFREAYKSERLADRVREAGGFFSCSGKSMRSREGRSELLPETERAVKAVKAEWSPYKPFKGLSE